MIVWFRIVCSFFISFLFFFATVSKIGITVSLGNGQFGFYHLKEFLFVENQQCYRFHCARALFC